MDKIKILIVEDEAIIALNIQNILELREYEITGIAKSGKDAISMVSTHDPDLILMDIILKGEMDGITTYEKIKGKKNIPVVYLTAHSDKKTLHRAKKTEPHGYIIKPISQDELFSAIEIALYKHKMEMILLESVEKYRLIFENSPLAVVHIDKDGIITDCNKNLCKILGSTRKKIIGFNTLTSLKDEKMQKTIKSALSGKKSHYEADYMSITGGVETPLSGNFGPIVLADGSITGAIGIMEDTTNRHKAEDALRESEEKFRKITEESLVGVYLVQDQLFKYVNPRFAETFEYTVDEMIDKINPKEIVHEMDWHSIIDENIMKKSMGDSKSMSYNFRVMTKNKKIIFIEVYGARMMYKGKPAIIGTVLDISDRRIFEETLQENEEKFRMIFENSPIAMVHLNKMGIITTCNNNFCNIMGASIEKLIGFDTLKSIRDKNMKTAIKSALSGKDSYYEDEYESIAGSKTTTMIGHFGPIHGTDGSISGVVGIFEDVTERKKIETALLESEKKFKDITEKSLVGVYLIQDNVFKYVNPRYAEIFDYAVDEIVGKMSPEDLTFHEDWPIVDDYIRKRETGEIDSIHYTFRNKIRNGNIIHIEVYGSKTTYNGKPAVIGTLLEVTDRINADKKIKQSLEEKETLLKEIHHRVKNNMQIITSLLNLQRNNMKDKTDFAIFEDTERRIRSMALVHEKLYMSKNLSEINFNDYINTISSEISQSFIHKKDKIKLKCNVLNLKLVIDKAIPCGIILNELISNSYKHAFKKNQSGEISINFKINKNGEYILKIKDTGKGMPENFEIEKSDSLGLKLVNALTKQLDGDIKFSKGTGTSVTIKFTSREL